MYYVIVGQSKSGTVYIQDVQVKCVFKSDWALGGKRRGLEFGNLSL